MEIEFYDQIPPLDVLEQLDVRGIEWRLYCLDGNGMLDSRKREFQYYVDLNESYESFITVTTEELISHLEDWFQVLEFHAQGFLKNCAEPVLELCMVDGGIWIVRSTIDSALDVLEKMVYEMLPPDKIVLSDAIPGDEITAY